MGNDCKIREVRMVCDPDSPRCDEVLECVYTLEGLQTLIKPDEADGDGNSYSAVERASFARADIEAFQEKLKNPNIAESEKRAIQMVIEGAKQRTPFPNFVWGDTASTYLEAILGKRKK